MDEQHPALAGHFPQNPIYPGVVILNQILAALDQVMAQKVLIKEVCHCKFLSPLPPGGSLEITFNITEKSTQFKAYHQQTLIVNGQLIFEQPLFLESS